MQQLQGKVESHAEALAAVKARLCAAPNVDGDVKEGGEGSRLAEPHNGLLHISDFPAFVRLLVCGLPGSPLCLALPLHIGAGLKT